MLKLNWAVLCEFLPNAALQVHYAVTADTYFLLFPFLLFDKRYVSLHMRKDQTIPSLQIEWKATAA